MDNGLIHQSRPGFVSNQSHRMRLIPRDRFALAERREHRFQSRTSLYSAARLIWTPMSSGFDTKTVLPMCVLSRQTVETKQPNSLQRWRKEKWKTKSTPNESRTPPKPPCDGFWLFSHGDEQGTGEGMYRSRMWAGY